MEIKNAIIKRTFLGIEDHGIFTFSITLEGDGFGVAFGGYSLDTYDTQLKERVGVGKSLDIIKKVLYVVGVDSWENLVGKAVRITTEGWGSSVNCIGNLISDKWVDLEKEFHDE